MEIKLKDTYKGTRILMFDSAKEKRNLINKLIDIAYKYEFGEVFIPIINKYSYFENKVGEENNNLMYRFKDRADRDLCLAPEYTAIIQKLAEEKFKYKKECRLFYVGECFRGEKPQAGRYRQFTQFGLEIINPDYNKYNVKDLLIKISEEMVSSVTKNYQVNDTAKRGLDYYVEDGFEISCPELGGQSQVVGGGKYPEGIGFAIGLDRLLLINKPIVTSEQ